MSSASNERSLMQSSRTEKKQKLNSKSSLSPLPQNLKRYLLQDYTFLSEYQLLDSPLNSQFSFLARIKSTQQLVRFKKCQFLPVNTARGLHMYKRFEILFALFQNGVILADNIFILEQANKQHFYYIIQPYLSSSEMDSPFVTLQQYLFENNKTLNNNFQSKKSLFIRCKNLLDQLSLYGQQYCGLSSRKILVDDQGNVFLVPFQLECEIINRSYQRTYYPLQVLNFLKQQQNIKLMDSFQKWDIWSFGCITLDIFLYLTPFFLSTSIERQQHKIKNQISNIFKDFQSEFLKLDNTQKSTLNEKQQTSSEEDKQKILNFLMNIFHEDVSKRQFSFEPIQKETQLLKSVRRTSRVKSSTRKLFQKTQLKSKEKLTAKTEWHPLIKNPSIQSSRILTSSSQVSAFKELNICQNSKTIKNDKINNEEIKYNLQLRIKTLILQNLQEYSPKCHSELQIRINFVNGQKFQFFVSFPSQTTQQTQLSINRKITFLQRQLKFLEDLLEQDIHVMIQIIDEGMEQKVKSEIFINLSSLVIKNQSDERIWKKPIKGTYQTQKDSHFSCKIKIQAEILELCPIQNSIPKSKISKVQKPEQKTQNNFSIVHWLQDIERITHQNNEKNKFSQQQILTQRFVISPAQQQIVIQKEPQIRNQKKSISKFSSINFQLDEISTYWKQRIQNVEDQQNHFSQPQCQNLSSQKMLDVDNNALKEFNIQQSTNIEENQQNEVKTLETKVKKILQQNRRAQKLTEPIDLSKRLKRLLMR